MRTVGAATGALPGCRRGASSAPFRPMLGAYWFALMLVAAWVAACLLRPGPAEPVQRAGAAFLAGFGLAGLAMATVVGSGRERDHVAAALCVAAASAARALVTRSG